MVYNKYKTNPRPTEFIWATNLANLLVDTVDCSAALWKEISLFNLVKPETFEVFIQNFRSLVYHTSEYIANDKQGVVKQTDKLFKSNLMLDKQFTKDKVVKSLNIFEDYNKQIHHSNSIMKLIEDVNVVNDSGS